MIEYYFYDFGTIGTMRQFHPRGALLSSQKSSLSKQEMKNEMQLLDTNRDHRR